MAEQQARAATGTSSVVVKEVGTLPDAKPKQFGDSYEKDFAERDKGLPKGALAWRPV